MNDTEFDKRCESILNSEKYDIENVLNGEVYYCHECNEWHYDPEWMELPEMPKCPDCDEYLSLVNMVEYCDICAHEVEYRIKDYDIKTVASVCITLQYGGPNVYLDTEKQQIDLYWGSTHKWVYLTKSKCDLIDDAFDWEWKQRVRGL